MTADMVTGDSAASRAVVIRSSRNEKSPPLLHPPTWTELPHVVIGGQPVATASRAALADAMAADCHAARHRHGAHPRLIFDVNGQGLSMRRSSPAYRDLMARADVVHADGGFLVTASKWFCPTPIVERSATTDLIHDFAARAERDGLSFYLLGAAEDVNAASAAELQRLYPDLRIVGRRNGYFAPHEEDAVVAAINEAAPDVLWVGLGKPKEQSFAARNARRLRAGWLVTCGGCFNFLAGEYRRAPAWMQNANLEWLHRMATRPKELFWRYLVTTPHALWLMLTRI
jgi:N-acetylglucosaminyldiphosphoundecaprenol N-acetyl-beta-D-mannosaminyltransferase